MIQHSSKTCLWWDILTTSILPGFTALVGMLALEYLVTGSFDAAKAYLLIALTITCALAVLQWCRYRPHRHAPEHKLPPAPHPHEN